MDWYALLPDNLHVYFVCTVLIVAAWIDGKQLRVPNWLTFPMVFSGLAFNVLMSGWDGLGTAVLGTAVGLATLLPLYAVGGMGAGDVKLMGGIGAWLGPLVTWYAFCVSVIVGAVMAIVMVLWKRSWQKHYGQFLVIAAEWLTIKNPSELSRLAAERKSNMLLLPYGIPICVGSIAYFFYAGLI